MKKATASIILVMIIGSIITMGCTTPRDDGSHKVKVTINSKQYSDTIGSDWSEQSAKEGYHFFIIRFTVENVGSEKVHTNPLHTTISTTNGQTYDHALESYSLNDSFDAVDVQPGNYQMGSLAYEIPTTATPKSFYYDDGFFNSIEINL